MALKSSIGADVRGVVHLTIHDQLYLQIDYSPTDEKDKVYRARLGTEAAYPDVCEGDSIVVHSLMNVVTRIEKA